MSDDPKKKIKEAAKEIDVGLNGLFGALGDAIGEMVTRLEDGTAGSVTRDHVFETDKGPVRAQAGVRLRMGGMDVGPSASAPSAKPVNPNRARTTSVADTPPPAKPLEYDIFEDAEAWILTADMPGVSRGDLALEAHAAHLHLTTTGARRFQARVELGNDFDFEGIETRLHNGVLTLNIPKTEAA